MPSSKLPPIAIIADAHFHDLSGDYGAAGIVVAGSSLAVRPFADTVRSTRVFNESGHALRHALDDISRRGIRHVVLLGDYSDDGQAVTMAGLCSLLDEYRARDGMRFFATPGNHDVFAMHGRHRSKRFLNSSGSYDLVTSNPYREAGHGDTAVIVTEGMRCSGYPDGLLAMPDAGFFRSARDLHWETPFGVDDDPAERMHEMRSPDGETVRWLMDASYLVEPFEGVWMLMIDANVFVPENGAAGDDEEAFADSTNAGWNAMLVHKRFVLHWMKDVADRAKRLGKTLIAFSHYPALDPFDGTHEDELAVLGGTSLLKRVPNPDVGEALISTGIGVHFSGHLHINDTARFDNADGSLVNISVPSLVAFPAAYKILGIGAGQLTVETIEIGDLALDDGIMSLYRTEAGIAGISASGLLNAQNYGIFLSEHLGHLVGRRFLRREWPAALAEMARTLTLADLAADIADDGVDLAALSRISVMTFLGDWYRVRMGSDLGLSVIDTQNLAAYRLLSNLYSGKVMEHDSGQASFGKLFHMFDRFISGLPSRNFAVDTTTGEIKAA